MADRLKTLQDNDGNTIYPNTVVQSVLSNDTSTQVMTTLGNSNISSLGNGTITGAISAISNYSTYPPYVSEGKEKIAKAITQKGVFTNGTDEFQVMADNIMNINRIDIPYQEKTIKLDANNPTVEVIPDIGYDWLTKVTASVELQNKSVDIKTGMINITPDDGKVIGSVLVNGPTDRGAWSETLDTTTTEITVPEGYHDGTGKVSISTQSKSVSVGTGTTTIKPDDGKVLSQVTVVTSLTSQSKSVSITSGSMTVYPDSGKLLSSVSISGPSDRTGMDTDVTDSSKLGMIGTTWIYGYLPYSGYYNSTSRICFKTSAIPGYNGGSSSSGGSSSGGGSSSSGGTLNVSNVHSKTVTSSCTTNGSFTVSQSGTLVVGLSAMNFGYDNNCSISKNGSSQSAAWTLGSQGDAGSVARLYKFNVSSGNTISYATGGPAKANGSEYSTRASCVAWLFNGNGGTLSVSTAHSKSTTSSCTMDGSFTVSKSGTLIVGLSAVNFGYDNNCVLRKNGSSQSASWILGDQGDAGSVARIYKLSVSSGDSITYATGGPAKANGSEYSTRASCVAWLFSVS